VTADQFHAQWVDEYAHLANQIHWMHIRAEVFDALVEEIDRRSGEGHEVAIATLRGTYADAQLVRVRRLVDDNRRAVSLVRLLRAMESHPDVLSRARHVARGEQHNAPAGLADRDFDDIAGVGADAVPAAVLRNLRLELVATADKVKRYVDQLIAHIERHASPALTWMELKQAIADVSRIYTRIGVILRGVHSEPAPTIIDPWQEAFRNLFEVEDRDWPPSLPFRQGGP